MRTTTLKSGLLHIETPLGVINIRVGLMDHVGRRVDSIEVIPDRMIGEKKVIRLGYCNTRMVELKGVRT